MLAALSTERDGHILRALSPSNRISALCGQGSAAEGFAWVGGQPDAREGVRAFLEKTTPAWKGNLDALDNAPFGEE